jgi:tRNA-2-methylthio-N6-dimethylallyladenosine synthase
VSDTVSIGALRSRASGTTGAIAPTAPAGPGARKVFVHTFGCQANATDSARMLELLGRHAFTAARTADEADLILLNTCAVREKAEQKLFSALGRYRELKSRSGVMIAVAGCIAQREKEAILKRVPYVDFVFGPDNLARLPEMIERAAQHERFAETAWLDSHEYLFPRADPDAARGRATAFVTAMKGCDNVCAFCIVPRTRGREVSRPRAEIVEECAALAAVGVREVTLIGQNVNSYAGGCTFAGLLRSVSGIDGIRRIRFTTSNPHDLSDELIDAFREVPEIMPHFHLPVQSGSDPVLTRMRRGYSSDQYLERFRRLQEARPGIAITTDFIVGFPGETEADFERSLALLEHARFDNSFSFIFSPRPGTVAALRVNGAPDWAEVPRDVAVERLERLQAAQRRIVGETLSAEVGREFELLVEGPSEVPARRAGRTPENRVVHFVADGVAAPTGALVRVRAVRAHSSSFAGELLTGSAASGG